MAKGERGRRGGGEKERERCRGEGEVQQERGREGREAEKLDLVGFIH